MERTNYYGVILSNGYLEDVYTSRKEAEECASKINNGDYSGPDYSTFSAEVVRGLQNIKRRAKGNWTCNEIKKKCNGDL